MKAIIRRLFQAMGYEIRHVSQGFGYDPFSDLRRLSESGRRLVVFDVGANIGQSVSHFRRVLDDPVIHSFEPSRDTFSELQRRTSGIPDLYLNNFALGSRSGMVEFLENTRSDMSSILEPSVDCWGAIKVKTEVEITTIDSYCKNKSIRYIDILKCDTQGFDLEVIKGAEGLMALRRIHMVYTEVTFSDMYK